VFDRPVDDQPMSMESTASTAAGDQALLRIQA